MEYASTVWDTTDAGDIADLEMVQRRAACFVHNNYTDRTPGCVTDMLNALRWEPLSQRRANSRLIMLYRIMNNLVDINASDFVNRADARTRGSKRLFQERTKHPVLHNSFFPRTIRQWNNLSVNLTESPSLEIFKAGLGSSASLCFQP